MSPDLAVLLSLVVVVGEPRSPAHGPETARTWRATTGTVEWRPIYRPPPQLPVTLANWRNLRARGLEPGWIFRPGADAERFTTRSSEDSSPSTGSGLWSGVAIWLVRVSQRSWTGHDWCGGLEPGFPGDSRGGVVQVFIRWLVAFAAVLAAFAAGAWLAGAWLLPHVMKSGSDRWAVAGGVGVAVAALAALWGFRFAGGESTGAEEASTGGGASTAFGGRSVTVEHNQGIVSQGDGAINIQTKG